VLNDPDVVAKNPEYLEMFKFAKYIKSRPKSPFYTQMSDIFQAELQSAIVQQKTAEQAMKDAAEQIQPILEQ
jgi:multiple sugar transport system substrate-binding protein